MTLDRAIRQLLHLGYKDPVDVVRELQRRHGDEWLRAEAAMHAEDYALGLAQKLLGSDRRSAEPARLRAEPVKASADLLLKSKWIPGVGWKRIGDLTAADCRAVAAHYEMLASAARVRGGYFLQLADMLATQGAAKVSELRGDLPLFELEQAA